MKRMKTIVTLLAAALMLFLMPGTGKLPATAAEPVTYSLKYMESEQGWRYKVGSWSDDTTFHELHYMLEAIKEGDVIVIESSDQPLTLEVPVRLSNVTFNRTNMANITAPGIDNVYVLRDSVAVINGDVVNAHVYDNAVANFNNNVTNLYITKDTCGEQTIAVAGTIAHLRTGDAEKVYNEFYDFQANSFRQEKGVWKTAEGTYSATPSGNVQQPVAPAAPAAPAGGEYDDVPKTGEPFALPGLLLIISGISFGGAYLLRKKTV